MTIKLPFGSTIVFFIFVMAQVAYTNTIKPSDVDRALLYLTEGAPNTNPVQTDEMYRREVSSAIVRASEETDVDVFTISVWVFYESAFKSDSIGALGEVGVGQTHGVLLSICDIRWNLDMNSLGGQIMCTAKHMARLQVQCGSLTDGLTAYASGSCQARTERTQKLVEFRMRKTVKLESEIMR